MKVLAVYRLVAAIVLAALTPFTALAAQGPSDPAALERAGVEKVNEARRERGLPPLTVDPTLSEVARRYSCAMAERGFFDHTAPDGTTMRDRFQAAGVRYRAAGENIARIETRGDPAERAVAGWLKSPGHRENILSKSFTATGIGACRAGRAVYFTQVFIRPR